MAKGIKTGGRQKGGTNKSTDEIKAILDANVDFSEIVLKLVELTNGIEVQVNTPQGLKVYSDRPDSAAAKILLEYRYGKPQQKIEHSGQLTEVIISKTILSKKQ